MTFAVKARRARRNKTLSNTVFLKRPAGPDRPTDTPRSIRGVVILSFLLAILLVAVLLFILPAFRVEKVIVSGNHVVQTEEILTICEVTKGEHLFSRIGGGALRLIALRYGSVEDKIIENFPYVKAVRVSVEIPSVVRITIEERNKIGYIDVPDGYAVIDTEGYVVELTGSKPQGNVPLIQGVPVITAVLGRPISLSDDRGFNRCLVIFGAALDADAANPDGSDYELMSCIRSVRYVGDNINFLVVQPRDSARTILVKIGSMKEIYEDMVWLRHALAKNLIDYSEYGVLDMSGAENTFRKNT